MWLDIESEIADIFSTLEGVPPTTADKESWQFWQGMRAFTPDQHPERKAARRQRYLDNREKVKAQSRDWRAKQSANPITSALKELRASNRAKAQRKAA